MIISVVNCTDGLISDNELSRAIRAINQQIEYDFSPYWHLSGQLRIEGLAGSAPKPQSPQSLRGDAIIYIWGEEDPGTALGFHARNGQGIPYGIVYTKLCEELGEAWTTTLSHEALELLGDPMANNLVMGPHPTKPEHDVFHWKEMCDAVQGESYLIDGIEVSNFVLPLYFTKEAEKGGRNDFLNMRNQQSYLSSFGVNPGGYFGYFDPTTSSYHTYFGSAESAHKFEQKQQYQSSSRIFRNQPDESAAILIEGELESPPEIINSQGVQLAFKKVKTLAQLQQLEPNIQGQIKGQDERRFRSPDAKGLDELHNALSNDDKMQFSEFAAFAIEPKFPRGAAVNSAAQVDLKLPTDHHIAGDEVVLALVMDGNHLISVHSAMPDTNNQFTIPVVNNPGGRGSLLRRVVRFVKTKVASTVKGWINGVTDKITGPLLEYIADKVESHVKETLLLRLQPFVPGKNRKRFARLKPIADASDLQVSSDNNNRFLLLVHGIFSSVEGAFGALSVPCSSNSNPAPSALSNTITDQIRARFPEQDTVLCDLFDKYGENNIIGFDHHTVGKSPTENVEELLAQLPDNIELDIICHSRGAAIVRGMLEQPALAAKLESKNIGVDKVLFVAGACQGSPLTDTDNIDTLTNVFSAFKVGLPTKAVLTLLTLVKSGLTNLPGISALAPNSQYIQSLNDSNELKANHYHAIRADFEPRNFVFNGLDELAIDRFIFDNKGNDVVVPYKGAFDFGGKESSASFCSKTFTEHLGNLLKHDNTKVHHINFFKQREVREAIRKIFC